MSNSSVPGAPPVLSLAAFSSEALMVPRLQARDVPGIVRELSQLLHQASCVPGLLAFYHAVLNREFLGGSALKCGVAVPHARLDGLQRLAFALGRSAEPVVWGAKGALPVHLVFLIAAPTHNAADYLHLVSGIARLGGASQLLTNLRAADSPAAMFSALEQIKVHSGGDAAGRSADWRESSAR